jgi:hypothetical protein
MQNSELVGPGSVIPRARRSTNSYKRGKMEVRRGRGKRVIYMHTEVILSGVCVVPTHIE